MWKLSSLLILDTQRKLLDGRWIPARPLNEDYKSLKQRIKEAWAVFTGKASAFTWD